MRLLWCLVALVVVVTSGPVTQPQLLQAVAQSKEHSRNSQLEELLLGLIESLRDIILNGSGFIPPLDPLEINQLTLDDNIIPLPGAKISLTEAAVTNLGSFEVDKISITMTSLLQQLYKLELDIIIPVLEVEADQYDLNISALGFNIFGNGSLKLKIKEPKIITDFDVRLNIFGGLTLELRSCTVKFDLTAFEPEITGLFGHEGASDFVNLFLKDVVPALVDVYEPEITQFLSETVFTIASQLLADLDLGDLINP